MAIAGEKVDAVADHIWIEQRGDWVAVVGLDRRDILQRSARINISSREAQRVPIGRLHRHDRNRRLKEKRFELGAAGCGGDHHRVGAHEIFRAERMVRNDPHGRELFEFGEHPLFGPVLAEHHCEQAVVLGRSHNPVFDVAHDQENFCVAGLGRVGGFVVDESAGCLLGAGRADCCEERDDRARRDSRPPKTPTSRHSRTLARNRSMNASCGMCAAVEH